MKIYSIVSEQVDEAIPFTKKARMQKAAGKAAKGATKDEARQLEVELLTYLKTSKQPATAGAVLNYFKQKGYGNVANKVIKSFQTKGMKKTAKSAARDQKAQAAGAAAAKLGGLAKQGAVAGAAAAKQGAKAAGGAIKKAAAKAKDLSGVDPASYPGAAKDAKFKSVRAGMYSEAQATDVLTKREVRSIISQVVAGGYGDAAGFDKGRFAQKDQPAAGAPQIDPADAKMINSLKKKGYTITKKAG